MTPKQQEVAKMIRALAEWLEACPLRRADAYFETAHSDFEDLRAEDEALDAAMAEVQQETDEQYVETDDEFWKLVEAKLEEAQ